MREPLRQLRKGLRALSRLARIDSLAESYQLSKPLNLLNPGPRVRQVMSSKNGRCDNARRIVRRRSFHPRAGPGRRGYLVIGPPVAALARRSRRGFRTAGATSFSRSPLSRALRPFMESSLKGSSGSRAVVAGRAEERLKRADSDLWPNGRKVPGNGRRKGCQEGVESAQADQRA
jgi:hypothetical protein